MSKIIMPNAGIATPYNPDVTITITLDTKTNQTKLMTNKAMNRLTLSGILQQHALSLTSQVIMESMNSKPTLVGGTDTPEEPKVQ